MSRDDDERGASGLETGRPRRLGREGRGAGLRREAFANLGKTRGDGGHVHDGEAGRLRRPRERDDRDGRAGRRGGAPRGKRPRTGRGDAATATWIFRRGATMRHARTSPVDVWCPPQVALRGHKWFTSAPNSDGFLTLAKEGDALSCFLAPRVLPDGSRNEGFRVQRLKRKLGDRSNASSEVEYDNAYASPSGTRKRRGPFELIPAALECWCCPLYVYGNAGADELCLFAGTRRASATKAAASRPSSRWSSRRGSIAPSGPRD